MDDQTLNGGPDKRVPPRGRRGTLVVPDEEAWFINQFSLAPTSGALRKNGPEKRIAPEKSGRDEHIPPKADVTSTSLRCCRSNS